ncbi:MAG TPA: CPBP family intramembrane glutamic endopeptidase [Fimbriimonadaceae bacterium]|nr:CPBP family intramembrane glutamic endopeptidase [Fimbriimonadaceae bacterium]
MQRITRRQWLWLELGAVVALCCLPYVWYSLLAFLPRSPSGRNMPPELRSLETITLYLRSFVPGLFIIWSSGEGLSRFGFSKPKFWPALAFVLGAFVLMGLAVALYLAFPRPAIPGPTTSEGDYFWRPSYVAITVVGLFMKSFVRVFAIQGYLITRLVDLGWKFWWAAAVSSVLYTAVHLADGLAFIPVYLAFGFFYAWSLRATKSIWPATIAATLLTYLGYAGAHMPP